MFTSVNRSPSRGSQLSTAALVGAAVLALSSCGNAQGQPPTNAAPDQTVTPNADPSTYAWQAQTPAPGSLVLKDRATGSLFNLRGEAFAGPLAAEKRLLIQAPGFNMFWFAWSVFHAGSEIWGRDDLVRQGALPATKTGSSACGGGADCIPSLPNAGEPRGDLKWASVGEQGAGYLGDDDMVFGVFLDGAARAYPHNVLWWHEIANDHIGDRKFTVSFCPLTSSGFGIDGGNDGRSFGVSGNLFNSNLVMYDHQSNSLWPQLWQGAVSGTSSGAWLDRVPLSEMTWRQWKKLHPETLVVHSDTGFSRNYTQYPYGDYRTDNGDTFRQTNPTPDPLYGAKAMTFGLMDRVKGVAKAYVHEDLERLGGARAVINDTFSGTPVVLVYLAEAKMVLAFESTGPDATTLKFDAVTYAP